MMACRTGKRRYPDELEARLALARIAQLDVEHRAEQRAYFCEFCCGWHLTHQPPRGPVARRRRRT
jgi:hypothetical protein